MSVDALQLGALRLQSRLLLGTGRFRDFDEMTAALEASATEMVTVAVRRVDLQSPETVFSRLDRKRYTLLPNTSGCFGVDDAVRTALLAREALETNWIKLEVIGDQRTLLPDVVGTLQAAERLVKEGFWVLPYTTDDLNVALRLQDLGCLAVMPLASPIGSGRGLQNPAALELLLETVKVPVIIDAGIGAPSHAAKAMEMGAAAVLLNTAVAAAGDPPAMAYAMRLAVEAGRRAYLARPMQPQKYASASSPLAGLIQ